MFDFIRGFRKFIVMLTIIVVGIIFRLINLINGAEFVTLISTSSIGFFAANVGSNITGALKSILIKIYDKVSKKT